MCNRTMSERPMIAIEFVRKTNSCPCVQCEAETVTPVRWQRKSFPALRGDDAICISLSAVPFRSFPRKRG